MTFVCDAMRRGLRDVRYVTEDANVTRLDLFWHVLDNGALWVVTDKARGQNVIVPCCVCFCFVDATHPFLLRGTDVATELFTDRKIQVAEQVAHRLRE